tara:strand:+ start:129 stop:563 length:435 start_codon:yes stop_codon:yes gene_type:complete
MTQTPSGNINMNICTYVSPISLKPKQYMVALYEGTKSLELATYSEKVVLQVLNKNQIDLVRSLGKRSGYQFNKDAFLRKKNLLSYWKNYELLKGANAYIELEKQEILKCGGDHQLFIYEVISSKTNYEIDSLGFQDLMREKIIL